MVVPDPGAAKGPEQVQFHLTGFVKGSASGAFGASLASEIFAEMRKILQNYEHAALGGTNMVNKMAAVVKALDNLSNELQQLGTTNMDHNQLTAWVANFNKDAAKVKAAIEALGNPVWIKTLLKSLGQVESLVTSTDFLKVVQDAAKQLLIIQQQCDNYIADVAVNAGPLINAYKNVSADTGAMRILAGHLGKVAAATNDPAFSALAKNIGALAKSLQKLLDDLYWMFGNNYTKWLEDTEKGDKAAAAKDLAHIQYLINTWQSWDKAYYNTWKQMATIAGKGATTAQGIGDTKISPEQTAEIINAIEMGKAGLNFTDFPQLDAAYKSAMAGIEAMNQISGQFSRSSVTTLNTLMTGMSAIIRNFNQAMQQPLKVVDFSLGNILKRRGQ